MEKEDHIALLMGKYGISKIHAYELVIVRFHCVVCENSRHNKHLDFDKRCTGLWNNTNWIDYDNCSCTHFEPRKKN